MSKVNPVIQWWVSPKLPVQHIFIEKSSRSNNTLKLLRLYLRKWLLHPIKRRVAKYYLSLLKNVFGLRVVAVTGSAGKTTVKEMIKSILGTIGETQAMYKNIDPVYNIPTTILKCTPKTKFLVLEMGVEYPGEMDFYLWMAKPDIALITNIYPTHTQFFIDVDNVAKEKLKLIGGLSVISFAVLYSKDKYLKHVKVTKKTKIVFYPSEEFYTGKAKITNDLKSSFMLNIGKARKKVILPVAGDHFVENALGSSVVTYLCGASIDNIRYGLETFKTPEHRMALITLESGVKIVDDSYNNNPEAAKATIRTFAKFAKGKKKAIIFGDMLELGIKEKEHHRKIAEFISKYDFELVIGVGKASKTLVDQLSKSSIKSYWVDDQVEVDKYLRKFLKKDWYILIKGSRSIGLDKLVARLSV